MRNWEWNWSAQKQRFTFWAPTTDTSHSGTSHPWKQPLSRAQLTFFWMAPLGWNDSLRNPTLSSADSSTYSKHTQKSSMLTLSWQCANSPLQWCLQRGTGDSATSWFVLQPLLVGCPSHSSILKCLGQKTYQSIKAVECEKEERLIDWDWHTLPTKICLNCWCCSELIHSVQIWGTLAGLFAPFMIQHNQAFQRICLPHWKA